MAEGSSRSTRLDWLLRLLTAAALAVDAGVHFHLAPAFDPIKATVSQGQLFRLEAAGAVVAALLVLVFANRITWALAFLVLAGGFAAAMFYQYVDPGPMGPLPDMYDPYWTTEKVASVIAEGGGAVVAAVGLLHARQTGK